MNLGEGERGWKNREGKERVRSEQLKEGRNDGMRGEAGAAIREQN